MSANIDGSISWFEIWADELVCKFIPNPDKRPYAKEVILKLMDGVSLGNTCISVTECEIDQLGVLIANSDSVAPFVYEDGALYLHRHFALEAKLAEQVCRILNTKSKNDDPSPYKDLLSDEHQRRALEVSFTSNLTIITGGPGTGKTYTLSRIIASHHHNNPALRIGMAAPTGKAAQRMKEALSNAFSDKALIQKGLVDEYLECITPVTLHRLLGIGYTGKPVFNADNKLPYDILVVDEVSMLDLGLAAQLFNAVESGTRVILLGDANQLASVDIGYVLYDLQNSNAVKPLVVDLKHSRRFSDDAMIGKLAKFIQVKHSNNKNLISDMLDLIGRESLFKSVDEHLEIDKVQYKFIDDKTNPKLIHEDLYVGYAEYVEVLKSYIDGENISSNMLAEKFDNYRVLCATKMGDYGLTAINNFIKDKLLADLNVVEMGQWFVGRPIMVTENNYRLGLSNGDIGLTLLNRSGKDGFEVYFPSADKWVPANRLPQSILTAFALTIHKSQGSEFKHVAVVMGEDGEKLLSQELLYTAITRAKKVVSLFIKPESMVKALTTKTIRHTGLKSKINRGI